MDPNNFKSGTLWIDPAHPRNKPFMVWHTHEYPDDSVSSETDMEIVTNGWANKGGCLDTEDADLLFWTKNDGWDFNKMKTWEPAPEPEPEPETPAKRWGVIDLDWLDKEISNLRVLGMNKNLSEFGVGRINAYEEILNSVVEL